MAAPAATSSLIVRVEPSTTIRAGASRSRCTAVGGWEALTPFEGVIDEVIASLVGRV